ncbi:hypothetical protein NBRC10512v2_005253 [Rhodotorula toruloides]|uniref:RHTO0S25e01992g1_1 n=1 Tax=Rhodotorula toruloides TaxID=5286 RepID=A0A061BQK9_RHOTO|nr:RHTO0S25e01992g1_1 [Rhodotorula toruloides]
MGSTVSHIDQADYPAAQGVALQLNSDWTLGPLFFGWTANVFLCGVTVSWLAGYWRRAKGDRWTVKSAVLVAACSEVVTAILNMLSIISHGKDQNRSNDAISLLRGPDALSVLIGAFAAVAAQAFFAARCWRVLPKAARIPFLLWTAVLVLASAGSAFGITIVELINHGATDATRGASPDAYENLYNLALAWLFCGAAADISISAVLITRLWQKKRAANAGAANAGRPGADGGLGGFMRVTFEAALCTTITAIVSGFTYVTLTETTNLSYAFSNLLPGLYALSLLWVLNSAHRLAEEIKLADLNTIQLVWDLSASLDGGSDGRDRCLSRIVEGTVSGADGKRVSSEWEIKRGLASLKARGRLGENVQMLSIGRKASRKEGDEGSFSGKRLVVDGGEAELWLDEVDFRSTGERTVDGDDMA